MVERVLNAIIDGLHTRRDIAEALGVSQMAVGKAVRVLSDGNVISVFGKAEGELGRKSEFLDISENRLVLLLDLTGDGFAYSLSPMSSDRINIKHFEYNSALDFGDNISVLLSHISRLPKPAIALAAIELKLRADYSGEDILEIFKRCGFESTVFVGANETPILADGEAYIYIGKQIFGIYGGKLHELQNVPVSAELTYGDAIKCAPPADALSEYTGRFVRTIDAVLSPRRIFVSSALLPKKVRDDLTACLPKLEFSSPSELMMQGLMAKAVEKTIKNILMK